MEMASISTFPSITEKSRGWQIRALRGSALWIGFLPFRFRMDNQS